MPVFVGECRHGFGLSMAPVFERLRCESVQFGTTISMKAAVYLSAALVCCASAEVAIPVPYEAERYVETLSKPPFALKPLDPTPIEPETLGVLDRLVVTGLGKLDDGRDYVVLQEQGAPLSIRLEGNQPTNGLVVKSVSWGDKWRVSSVMVSDGAKEKSIEFNQTTAPREKPTPPKVPKGPQKPGKDVRPVLTR